MKRKIIKYDGCLFSNHDLLEEYIVNEIGDIHKFNNGDPANSAEFDECYKDVEEIEVEWHYTGKHAEVSANIKPILDEIDIVIHTTLKAEHLNRLIKDLQIAVNRIDGKEFYGN